MAPRLRLPALPLALLLAASPSLAAPEDIAVRTAGMAKQEGLLTFHLDSKAGKVWLEVPAASGPDGEVGTFIHVGSLRTGLGVSQIGLDRGEPSATRLVTLRRVGGHLLIEQQNPRFRTLSENPDELRTVRESFATSVLWGGEIAVTGPDGRALVDLTGFLLRDALDAPERLREASQGSWSLDPSRSVADLENCLAFPDNVEFEALLTYQSNDPGELLRETVPAAGAVTFSQHQSLIRLPDAEYEPRAFDPRTGVYVVTFSDFAAPLDEPVERRWITRQRLKKVDPAAPRSRVEKPIVFYVDPGMPEPVRSAVIEGTGWWREAFEKAGFVDAYRVEILPSGAHPLDVRYHVIQWAHHAARDWSYAGGVIDPRTGEILKSQIVLSSQTLRPERLILDGLLGTEKTGTGAPDDPLVVFLARVRHLAAHEVGHALGLSHNFAASTYDRSAIMDYPAPRIGIGKDEQLDFSSAYGAGLGEWDLWAIRAAYSEDPSALIDEAIRRGLLFLTDEDTRPAGAADPRAAVVDVGPDPVAGLRHALEIRRIALSRFGERNVRPGQPLALLHEVLKPVYLYHRNQLEAALKTVGGVESTYAVRGDGQPGQKPVDGERQREALRAVLETLEPERLDLPEPVIALLLPRPPEYRSQPPEMFQGSTTPVFDPLGAAAEMAGLAVAGLLQPERVARLVDLHRRDPKLPGLEEVLGALVETSFGISSDPPRRAEIRRMVQWVTVQKLIGLARDPNASPLVLARVDAALRSLARRLEPESFLAAEIARHLERPEGARKDSPAP